ncbi:MAG: MepB family protein [Spirosomataceae bacterium]|jgi:hypothetical protein
MNDLLFQIKTQIYDKLNFDISGFKVEKESTEYAACKFGLNKLQIIGRNAKITPRKVDQFVTFWKRNGNGRIEPFEELDYFDFYVVNVRTKNTTEQFVFPKSVLMQKGIISTDKKEGKRAFWIYPKWDIPNNKQTEYTQK